VLRNLAQIDFDTPQFLLRNQEKIKTPALLPSSEFLAEHLQSF